MHKSGLIEQIFLRLPEKIRQYFLKLFVRTDFILTDEFYGSTLRLNPNIYLIEYSKNKCEKISDLAFQGVVAHEYAELYNFIKLFGIIRLLEKYRVKQHKENNIDKIAISWGFEKEIKQMRLET